MSALRVSEADPEVLIFEAQVSAEYPADNKVGEAKRMEWVEDWMKIRKFCPDGFEVIERRRFKDDEPNPYDHDLRYQLKCKLEES